MRLAVAIAVVIALAGAAAAHDLRPGVLSVTEQSRGEYALHFTPPIDSRGDAREVTIEFPPGCTRDGNHLHCAGGISGVLAVHGMRGAAMKTLVILVRGGERAEWILDRGSPQITIGASPPSTVLAWIRLGIAHILAGFDHLAFVVSLLLVLDFSLGRRLLVTVTAFTLAHSLTLALAVLGILSVRSAPVEACIALSVLLVAREATHDEPTAIRRWPWLAAGAFGLIHGLGFASALRELGLPREALARTLVSFNIGVELGQLAVVAVLVAVVAVARRLVGERRVVGREVHRAACYLLGALAAWWLLDRIVELLSSPR